MAPLKAKNNAGQAKVIESRESNKRVDVCKFKIYSENVKVNGRKSDNTSATSSRTSLTSKKGTLMTKDLASGAGDTRGSQNTLDKMKVRRKALADVSNVRGNSSRVDKPVGSRSLMAFGTLSTTASSSRPLAEKVKLNLTHGVTMSHASSEASTKATRNSSSFHRVQAHETAENKPRQISRSNNTITRLYAPRNSFPVLRRAIQSGANNSQGDVKSPEKAARKLGFPLKARVGGKVASQASNHKGRILKDRVSNVLTAPRNQANKDVPAQIRKSVKPVARTTSQPSNARKNCKSNRISSLKKSLVTISAKGAKVVESSVPKSSKSIDSHEEVSGGGFAAEDGGIVKPKISETSTNKRTKRRKSYTSLLISSSKMLGKSNDVIEQEKLPNIDDEGNPLEVAEYVDDIYQYYWMMEAQSASLENYMIVQEDFTPQMRGILVNWLIEAHFKFDLMPETLYLAIALLDRYLSLVSIKKKEIQLVGLTSLLLASKYEDFWHPRVKDLVSISAESYTRKQMLEMEKDILKKLKFRLNLPTAYVFMLRFLKASQSGEQLEHLAFYLIELCLVDYEALKFRPSLLCASAVYIARCTLNKAPAWTPLLSKHARYEESQIRDCAEMILRLHKAASTGVLKVTYDKYTRPEFSSVAAIKPLGSLPL